MFAGRTVLARKTRSERRPLARTRVDLAVAPAPQDELLSVIRPRSGESEFAGDQKVRIAMHCGGCGSRLAQGVPVSQFRGFLLRCSGCGEYLQTLGMQAPAG